MDGVPDEPTLSQDVKPCLGFPSQAIAPPNESLEFLDNLQVGEDKIVDVFGIHLNGDGFDAQFDCVFVRSTRRLFLQLVPARLPSGRSVQRVCSHFANSLVDFGEELGASSVHLCINKRENQYAVWMRSCLYVGFAFLSGTKTRNLLKSSDNVILRLKLNSFKDDASDCTVSTCYDSDSTHSVAGSPSSIGSDGPRSPSVFELNGH